MGYVDREIISELKTMIASSYDLSLLLTLAFASTPPGKLSPHQTDALVDLCYEMLAIQEKMKEIVASQPGQSDDRHEPSTRLQLALSPSPHQFVITMNPAPGFRDKGRPGFARLWQNCHLKKAILR